MSFLSVRQIRYCRQLWFVAGLKGAELSYFSIRHVGAAAAAKTK